MPRRPKCSPHGPHLGLLTGLLPGRGAPTNRRDRGEGAGCHPSPRRPAAESNLVVDGRLRGGLRQGRRLWSRGYLVGRGGGSPEDTGRTTLLQLPSRDARPGVQAWAPARQPTRPRHPHRDLHGLLAVLRAGPTAQTSLLGVRIWRAFARLSREGHRPNHAQWVPSHCVIEGNERVDTLAKEAAELPQEDIPVDTRVICRAEARAARESTINNWPAGWFRSVMGDHLPLRVTGLERSIAVYYTS